MKQIRLTLQESLWSSWFHLEINHEPLYSKYAWLKDIHLNIEKGMMFLDQLMLGLWIKFPRLLQASKSCILSCQLVSYRLYPWSSWHFFHLLILTLKICLQPFLLPIVLLLYHLLWGQLGHTAQKKQIAALFWSHQQCFWHSLFPSLHLL